jgi:hypothetical protein
MGAPTGGIMTSYREGYCRICGEYSQGIYIEFDRLCNACHDKLEEKDKPTVEKLKTFIQKKETSN